jgi:myo-inositol-1(or 4)-monophosphatase
MAAYLCYVARGTATGALVGRAAIWDIAAGLAILRRAGGDLHHLGSGTVIDLNSMLTGRPPGEPLIAGSPAAIRLLRERIRRLP